MATWDLGQEGAGRMAWRSQRKLQALATASLSVGVGGAGTWGLGDFLFLLSFRSLLRVSFLCLMGFCFLLALAFPNPRGF